MSHLISKSGSVTLAFLFAAAIGGPEAVAAMKPATPAHTRQQHAMMAMHAKHHGTKMDHRKHMAMMKQHGAMAESQHKTKMKRMHAMHYGGMPGPANRVAMMPPKQAGSCGTYMYWKAGACLDARSKK
jgi:hypothetical protein